MFAKNGKSFEEVDEELTHWKRPRCWERLGAGGEALNQKDPLEFTMDRGPWQETLHGMAKESDTT